MKIRIVAAFAAFLLATGVACETARTEPVYGPVTAPPEGTRLPVAEESPTVVFLDDASAVVSVAAERGTPADTSSVERGMVDAVGLPATVVVRPADAVSPADCPDWNTEGFHREADADRVEACLAGGSDPNASGDFGNTPLHWAGTGYNDDPEMVRVLVRYGADPNGLTDTGLSPLHTAAALSPSVDVIVALLEAGADPELRSGDGRLPVDYARGNGRLSVPEAVRVLEQAASP